MVDLDLDLDFEYKSIPDFQLIRVWHEGVRNFAIVQSFRHVAKIGLDTISDQINKNINDSEFSSLNKFIYMMDELNKQTDKIFETNDIKNIKKLELNTSLPQAYFHEHRMAIDAASLIFCHSILDGLIFDFCKIFALSSPKYWEKHVINRKITLGETKSFTYDELLYKKIKYYLELLEKESLITKIKRLLDACGISGGFGSDPDYKFDMSKIEDFDRNRHRIIHGKLIKDAISIENNDIEYYFSTASYFYEMTLIKLQIIAQND